MTAATATRLRKPKQAMAEFLNLYMVVILSDKIRARVRHIYA
jgi:hypothetical protein